MSAKYLAGFAVVCGLVVGGLDYMQQVKKAEGGLSVQDYVASISSRMGFSGPVAAAETRAFLPEAPEGWSRSAPSAGSGASVWGNLDRQQDAVGWVYDNGADVIWLEAARPELQKTKGVMAGMAEISEGKVARQPDYLGYAVVGGVGFAQLQEPAETAFRTFDGWVGFDDEIRVRVRAAASDEAILALLEDLDFDGLNNALKLPVPTIGQAVKIPSAQQPDIAAQMIALRRAMTQARADLAIERILNSDEHIALINGFVEGIAPDATLDATGGEVPDYETVLQTTYRNALALILAQPGAETATDAGASGPSRLTCAKTGISTRCRSGG